MNDLVTNIQGYSIHDGPGIRTVVFFKGCGLECQWCSNPECISLLPEVGFVKRLCTGCGKCAEVCPTGALVFKEDEVPHINRKLCTGCGECSEVCTYGAIVRYGKQMSIGEIFDTVYTSVTDTLIINYIVTNIEDKPIGENVVFKLYPNPTINELNIDIINDIYIHGYTIDIYSNSGVFKASKTINESHMTFDLRSYVSGIYHFQIKRNGIIMETKKIIIQ